MVVDGEQVELLARSGACMHIYISIHAYRRVRRGVAAEGPQAVDEGLAVAQHLRGPAAVVVLNGFILQSVNRRVLSIDPRSYNMCIYLGLAPAAAAAAIDTTRGRARSGVARRWPCTLTTHPARRRPAPAATAAGVDVRSSKAAAAPSSSRSRSSSATARRSWNKRIATARRRSGVRRDRLRSWPVSWLGSMESAGGRLVHGRSKSVPVMGCDGGVTSGISGVQGSGFAVHFFTPPARSRLQPLAARCSCSNRQRYGGGDAKAKEPACLDIQRARFGLMDQPGGIPHIHTTPRQATPISIVAGRLAPIRSRRLLCASFTLAHAR